MRFMALFAGLDRSHGTYALGKALAQEKKSSAKLTGPRKTVHEPVTEALWESHLRGTYGLGIVPIRSDNTVVFGAIDIDDYSIDLKALAKAISKAKLPLIVCRTKSGGAHLYCFTKEAVTAQTMRDKLVDWAIKLGHPGVEVFPKQVALASKNDPVENNTGNWINMPYAAAENTLRYALDAKGESLEVEEFLDLADKKKVKNDFALKIIEFFEELDEEFLDMVKGFPPCLTLLCKMKMHEGARNNFLFDIGVALKKRYGNDFKDHMGRYNERFIVPPLSWDEVTDTIKSLTKKDYSYKCKDGPIVSYCNKDVCRTCEYGVGTLPDDPGVTFGPMMRMNTDPPTWIWEINNHRLELDTKALMDQRRFQEECLNKISVYPTLIKAATWKKLVTDAVATTKGHEIEVPDEATRDGLIWSYLVDFCTSKVMAKAFDEVLLGKPWLNPEDKYTYFQGKDFYQYLQQRRVSGFTEKEVWKIFHRRGVEKKGFNIKGKFVNIWFAPPLQGQTEEFDVPRVKGPDSEM